MKADGAPPIPGIAPITTPMRLPRKIDFRQRRKSSQLARLWPGSMTSSSSGTGRRA